MTASRSRQEAIDSGILATLGNVLGKLVSVPVAVYVAAALEPEGFGVLAVATVVISYLSYANLGMLGNLTREVPMAHGRGDHAEVARIYSTIGTNYVLTTLAGLGLLWGARALGFSYGGSLTIEHFVVITVIVLAANAESFFYTSVKGEGQFRLFGQYELVRPLAAAAVQFALVYWLGLLGMLLSLAVMHLVGLGFIVARLKLPPLRWRIDLARTVALMRTGVFMYANKILDGVLASIGIIVAGHGLTTGDVGLLSFALGFASLTKVPFANIFTVSITRHMAVESGRSGENRYEAFQKYFGAIYGVYLLLLAAGLGCLVLFYGVVIDVYLQTFRGALPLLVLLYFALGFYNARYFLYAYINATGQMNRRAAILVVGILVAGLGGEVALWAGAGLRGVAVAVAAAMIVVSVHTVWVCFTQIFGHWRQAAAFLARLSGLTLVLTVVLAALLALAPAVPPAPGWTDWMTLAAALAGRSTVFLAVCYAGFLLTFRRAGLQAEVYALAGQTWRTLTAGVRGRTPSRESAG
jgi:O-antigen/teichoic acid export membrane protein